MRKKKLIFGLLFLMMCMLPGALIGQNISVTGNVISKTDGEPIIGASVVQTGTTNGTITDLDGNFLLNVPNGAGLTVSYIGYKTLQVNARPRLSVTLEEDSQLIDEVVVTGYTTQRKADLTGAVSVVKMDDILKQGENNPVKALQGRVPGMNISADGNPSGSATVRIRGIGTLNNNDPLYIIDGVPTKSGMHELNGNDIESIQVLKDAASASIYGSRAANGVIIITTKKGKGGKTRVNFDASFSLSEYISKVDVLNTKQYGQAMWQAYVNDGINPNSNGLGFKYNWGYDTDGNPVMNGMMLPKYLDSKNQMPASDTDWFDEITRTGIIHQYNLSVSNGTDRGNYFFSLGYYKNEGIIKNTDFERFSARVNSDYKLIGDILTIGQNLTINRTSETASPSNIISDALDVPSIIPVHTTDGGWGGPVGNLPDRNNPARVVHDNRDNKYAYWRLFGNAFLNLNPFKGFNVRTNFGLDYANKYQRNFTLPYENGYRESDKSAVELKQEHWTKWMWNAIATYEYEKGKHRGDVMIGTELNREDDINFTAYKEGYPILTPDYMWPDAGTGQAQSYGSGEGYSLVSFFGKLNYSYAERYLASVTLRHDGSSRFGKNNRYATFPSVSIGWRISEEAFMKEAKTIVDDLKLRASWGQTGNQDINNLARYTIFVSNYGTGDTFAGGTDGTAYDIAGNNGGGLLASGFKRDQLGNDDIKWETTTQTNIGLDFSLLEQSLYGSFDYFYKKTKDILTILKGIDALGEGGNKWVNAGSMKNTGFEFNLGYRNKTSFGLTYDINTNLSLYRNEVLFVPETVAAAGTFGGNGRESIIGHPIYSEVGYIADGLFQSQEEINNHATQEGAGPGRIRYRDLDKNGVIDENDQTWIYDPTPDFSYGANIYLEYKNFDLTMFWQGVQGVDVINNMKKQTDFWTATNVNYLNKGKRVLDAWSVTNTNSSIPALTLTDLNNEKQLSSYYVENGSFLKLRTAQIGYTFPSKVTSKLKMERLRLYVSGQNLLTIKSSSYSGEDPEIIYGYPNPMNITFGLNIGF